MNGIYIRQDKLATSLRPYLVELPYAAHHTELEAVLARIKTSFSEQEVHTRRIAQLIAGRKADLQAAQDLRSRITALLQGRSAPPASGCWSSGSSPTSGAAAPSRRAAIT